MGKHFLVSRTQVAHLLVVSGTDVSMQVWPTEASKVARVIWTIITQKQDSVSDYIFVRVPNTDIIVCTSNVGVRVVLVSFSRIVREKNKRGKCLPMRQDMLALNTLRDEAAVMVVESTIPDNARILYSCIAPSSAGNKYDRFYGCMEQQTGG